MARGNGAGGGSLAHLLARPLDAVSPAPARAVAHDGVPSRPARPPKWAPPESVPAAHPENLGENRRFAVESWHSPQGATYTEVEGLTLYKGVGPQNAVHFTQHGHAPRSGEAAGHSDPDWQGSYFHDTAQGGYQYANEFNEHFVPGTGQQPFLGGAVLKYSHGPAVVVTPDHHLTGDVGSAHAVLGTTPGGDALLTQLGAKGQILNNPLKAAGDTSSDPATEVIVPWNIHPAGSYTNRGLDPAPPR